VETRGTHALPVVVKYALARIDRVPREVRSPKPRLSVQCTISPQRPQRVDGYRATASPCDATPTARPLNTADGRRAKSPPSPQSTDSAILRPEVRKYCRITGRAQNDAVGPCRELPQRDRGPSGALGFVRLVHGELQRRDR